MPKKIKSRYKPKLKIGDQVFDIETRDIGIIKYIDNKCNLRDNSRSVKEYYVYWNNGGASRYDSYYFDNKILDPGNEYNPPQEKITVIPLTPTVKVFYSQNKKTGQP